MDRYIPRHAPKSKRRAVAALIAALVLAIGAVSLSLATRPTQLVAAPADIVLPAGLSGDDLHQWCVDRKAAGTTGLSSNAKNWLNGCIEVSKPIATPSPSPSGTPSPSPTTSSPSPTPTTPSPTPTTPSPTPTTPSPSPTTTSPSPSPSPTTTGPVLTGCVADPGVCGYPDAVSAGAHGTLAAYTGPTTITTAGTVIHDVAIASCLVVNAPNVVFRNVSIACNGQPYVVDNGVVRGGTDAYDTGVTSFDHVTLICTGHGGTAIGEARIVAVAVDITACENGFDIDTDITLTDSYLHDLLLDSSAHTDGVQVWPGGNNIVYRHNTVLAQGDTSAFITGGSNAVYTIVDNLLDGGAYSVYCSGNHGVLTGNRFGPIGADHTAPWGHTTDCTAMTASGNIEDATGLPAPIG